MELNFPNILRKYVTIGDFVTIVDDKTFPTFHSILRRYITVAINQMIEEECGEESKYRAQNVDYDWRRRKEMEMEIKLRDLETKNLEHAIEVDTELCANTKVPHFFEDMQRTLISDLDESIKTPRYY